MKHTTLTMFALLVVAIGCDSAKFSGGALVPTTSNLTPAKNDGGPGKNTTGQTFTFALKVGDGAPVVPQAVTQALPQVFLNGSGDALSGDQLASWQSSVYQDGTTPPDLSDVKATPIDLSKASGTVTIKAKFDQTTDKRTGSATQSVFVDGEAPKATLLRLSNSDDGSSSEIFWSATDNYRVKEDYSVLIACAQIPTDFAPKSHADSAKLPANCAVVHQGTDLHKLDSQINVTAIAIGGTTFQPPQVHYGIYIEDMVGLNTFTWISEPVDGLALLTLAATPGKAQYTNKRRVPITLQLDSTISGTTKHIDTADNSGLWPNYNTSLAISNPAPKTTSSAFQPTLALDLTGADGLYSFDFQVSNTQTSSNHKSVIYILDTTPPLVNNVHVNVASGILNAQATVDLTWSASDANGIASQTIEIMQTGDTAYTTVATVAGGQTSYSFPWGARSDKGFTIRITATDPAGNSGVGVSPKWTPQVFNAAVLTSSVECFFCHVKIVGDLGGIGFPSDAAVRSDSGENFSVTGKIYGTTGIPTLLAAKAVGGTVPNYDNSGYKIFPKNNVFPLITAAKITDSVNGTLRLGTLTINRVYTGNLVLDGSDPAKPIQLSGEVFITGDLVIKGKYQGVGTIYANNIFVVNDLVAMNSPFPFADDPDAAKAQAVIAVANKTDALYLGALNEVSIGSVENNLSIASGTPYAWLGGRTNFVALAQQAAPMKNSGGVNVSMTNSFYADPTNVADLKANVEVNRVDAYIYAQAVLQWRAFANILLNGGFMSPRGGIVSSAPYRIFHDPAGLGTVNWANNPRNGLKPQQNMIRYDYRLRTGGAGFETIKSFFDQQ